MRKVDQVEKSGGDIRSLGPPPETSAAADDRIQCPHCGRKYASGTNILVTFPYLLRTCCETYTEMQRYN